MRPRPLKGAGTGAGDPERSRGSAFAAHGSPTYELRKRDKVLKPARVGGDERSYRSVGYSVERERETHRIEQKERDRKSQSEKER